MNRGIKVFQYPDNLSSTTPQFYHEIENLLEPGVKMVLLDLKQVNFITSSGLIPLLFAVKAIKRAGCKLAICSVSEQVRMLFELTGIDKIFDSFVSDESSNPV